MKTRAEQELSSLGAEIMGKDSAALHKKSVSTEEGFDKRDDLGQASAKDTYTLLKSIKKKLNEKANWFANLLFFILLVFIGFVIALSYNFISGIWGSSTEVKAVLITIFSSVGSFILGRRI